MPKWLSVLEFSHSYLKMFSLTNALMYTQHMLLLKYGHQGCSPMNFQMWKNFSKVTVVPCADGAIFPVH